MKTKYFICILLFLIISLSNAQLKRQFLKVEIFIKPQKLNELIIKKINTKKIKNCLVYKFKDNKEIKYCDDKSDKNYVKYTELGKIQNTKFIVVNKFTYNEEFYILLNNENGKTNTLYGFPLRIKNSNKYLVYNNPATDIHYKIQLLEIKNDEIKLLDEVLFPINITPKRILRVNKTKIFILDNQNQIWKTTIKS